MSITYVIDNYGGKVPAKPYFFTATNATKSLSLYDVSWPFINNPSECIWMVPGTEEEGL